MKQNGEFTAAEQELLDKVLKLENEFHNNVNTLLKEYCPKNFGKHGFKVEVGSAEFFEMADWVEGAIVDGTVKVTKPYKKKLKLS